MDSLELFKSLKEEAQDFSLEEFATRQMFNIEDREYPPESLEYRLQLMARYNLETFFEIRNQENIDNIEKINQDLLKEFSLCIDRYMDENAPGQGDLKRYIRLVSTYLVFIGKRPLHPVGMIFSKNQRLIREGNKFFCPIKSKELHKDMSLCRYCICKVDRA